MTSRSSRRSSRSTTWYSCRRPSWRPMDATSSVNGSAPVNVSRPLHTARKRRTLATATDSASGAGRHHHARRPRRASSFSRSSARLRAQFTAGGCPIERATWPSRSRSCSVSCRQSGHSSRCRATRSRSAGGSSPRRYGTRSVSGCFSMSALLHRLLEGRQRAVQVDAHGRLGTLEHLGDLVGRHVLLHPEQDRGPLARRELVHRRGQLLHRPLPAQLVHSVDDRCRLPLEEWIVAVVTFVARPELPPAMLALVVQAEVDQDPVEPGRELRPPAEAPGRLVQSDERVLGEVACILGVTEDGPGETVRPLLVARHEEIERGLVPLGHTRAERFVRWLHSAVVPSSFTLSLLTPRPQGPLTLPPQ